MKRAAVFAALFVALPLAAQHNWTVVLPGIAEGPPYTVPLQTIPTEMVMRHYAVGHGTALNVPNDSFGSMELEAGFVFTTIGGRRQARLPGDFWTVDKGTVITFENPYPNAAALIHVVSYPPIPPNP